MLLVQTKALGSDTDGQEAAIALIREQFAAIATIAGPTLKLQLSGPGRFAVEARATIKGDVSRLSLIATLAIVAVLFFAYRSPRLVTLGLAACRQRRRAGHRRRQPGAWQRLRHHRRLRFGTDRRSRRLASSILLLRAIRPPRC
ncbi:MAG: hypothetical protein IPL58_12895 [Betaproteobacteria bacterium]|uniref:Membrane transport protein MMPL domain-containing protein n=1 Tax=Candidatus Proximibacter danicus TaxID=2954365 RepID=A0A9D7K342_9PROT|nr:hypothetical protein [Candidatus Proximibacter danicus]